MKYLLAILFVLIATTAVANEKGKLVVTLTPLTTPIDSFIVVADNAVGARETATYWEVEAQYGTVTFRVYYNAALTVWADFIQQPGTGYYPPGLNFGDVYAVLIDRMSQHSYARLILHYHRTDI